MIREQIWKKCRVYTTWIFNSSRGSGFKHLILCTTKSPCVNIFFLRGSHWALSYRAPGFWPNVWAVMLILLLSYRRQSVITDTITPSPSPLLLHHPVDCHNKGLLYFQKASKRKTTNRSLWKENKSCSHCGRLKLIWLFGEQTGISHKFLL